MPLVPLRGGEAAFYLAKGSDNEIADSAPMQEVIAVSLGRPRYTVYEITSAAKRYLHDNEVPVFKADVGGNGVFATITPIEIQYCGGRIILDPTDVRGATDVVKCFSGHYYTVAQFLGAINYRNSQEWKTEKYLLLGDSGPSTQLIHKQWSAAVEAYWANTQATLETAMTGTHNDILMTHEPGGTIGNSCSLTITNPGGTHALEITVHDKDISVAAGTSGGAITTTGAQLADALNRTEAVGKLGVSAELAAGNNGSGAITTLTKTNFTGGLDPVDYSSETDKVVCIFYLDSSDDERWEGYGVLQNVEPNIDAGTLIRQTLRIEGFGPSPLYYRQS